MKNRLFTLLLGLAFFSANSLLANEVGGKKKVIICKKLNEHPTTFHSGWYVQDFFLGNIVTCNEETSNGKNIAISLTDITSIFWSQENSDNCNIGDTVDIHEYGDDITILGNLKIYSAKNNIIEVKCPNNNTFAVYNYSSILPSTWSSYITNFSTDSIGNVVLKVYQPSNIEPFVVDSTMVSVTIQSTAFLAACVTGMSYPEIKDASEVISAPSFIWEVSPNPVISQVFTVKMSKTLAEIAPEISMYNLNGQLLKTYKVTSTESRFETFGLTEGMYILKISNGIETDEKRIYIGKKQ